MEQAIDTLNNIMVVNQVLENFRNLVYVVYIFTAHYCLPPCPGLLSLLTLKPKQDNNRPNLKDGNTNSTQGIKRVVVTGNVKCLPTR